MLYFANPCGSAEVVDAMRAGDLGFIATPSQGNRRPPGVAWCADNGCYSNRWDQASWWAFLERNATDAGTCLFAVAPDVVGDAAATLERSRPWLGPIRDLGYRVALVAQDGLEHLETPWQDIDALFIGGSTAWKLGPAARELVAEARARGLWVHMGRVNSQRRYVYAHDIGCDSVDGTFLTYGPRLLLPELLSWPRAAGDAMRTPLPLERVS